MLPRLIPFVRAVNSAARLQSVRCMSGGHGAVLSDKEVAVQSKATIDDLPKPSGSWKENYDRNNRKGNIYILVSVVMLGITLAAMQQAGCLYLHGPPPSLYKNK